MIKMNELPEVAFEREFEKHKEEKKKHKKNKKKKNYLEDDYIIHTETTNPSFLKMYRILDMLKVKNNDFFLALYDERLLYIDPFDENLTTEEQLLVINECKRNFWYFIREIVRIPVSGGVKKYTLHRGNLALNWSFLNSINFFLELPRQNFKSVSIDVILLWLYNFGTINTTMLIMNKEHKDAKDNLATIREIRAELPEYLRFDTRFNSEGKELILPQNKEDAFNPKTRNILVTKPCATSADKADNLGRGMRAPIQWFDEFAFLKYNMIIYDSSSPAASQASEEAERAGKPHCTMISTTPGSLETDYGKDAFEFKNLCLTFKEEFYDWDIDEVKELIRVSSSNGFINIIFSWRQLGRSNAYYEKMRQQLHENWFKIRREVLLQWISIRDNSPFDDDDLMKLQNITYTEDDVYKTIYIDKYYPVKLYEKPDPNVTLIISSDVAAGASRDYSTIVITDSKTKRAIGEFRNNKIDTLQFSKILYKLANDVFVNCMLVIERNNVGEAVISNLARTSVRSKLYYELVSEDDTLEKIKNGREDLGTSDNRKFGFWTNELKRDQMMELLQMIVHKYRERVRLPLISTEIQALEYNKKNKIDHPANGHDDVEMAYMIGQHVLYYSKILHKFGIIKLPDVDPETGMTEEEMYEKMIEEREKKERQENENMRAINSLVNNNNNTDNIQFKKTKTINDYYKELDAEKERIYNNNTNRVNFEQELGIIDNNYNSSYNPNRIDLLHQNNNNLNQNNNNFANDLVGSILNNDF